MNRCHPKIRILLWSNGHFRFTTGKNTGSKIRRKNNQTLERYSQMDYWNNDGQGSKVRNRSFSFDPKKIKIRESQRPDQDILSLAVRGSPMIVCFGTHQIKFKKPSNDSLSRSDFTKSLKINEIESDDEKDSDEDEDGESGSGSDSGGMVAKILQMWYQLGFCTRGSTHQSRSVRVAPEKMEIQRPHCIRTK